MVKDIKKSAKTLKVIVSIVLMILAIIPILLSNSRIQNYVAQIVSNELSSKLHSKVSVGSVEYRLFNSIKIRDLYVEDLQHDTLLFVDQTKAHFNLRQFIYGRIIVNSLEFKKLYGNLKSDTLGHTNFEFVIKAFESSKKDSTSSPIYKISRFKIIDSKLSFSRQNGMASKGPEILNPDSMTISDLNTEIQLHLLTKDTLSAELKSLSFREKSGFVVDRVSTEIQASGRGARLPFLELMLPASRLSLSDIEIKYDSLSDLKDFVHKVKLTAPINHSEFTFNDFSALIPELKDFNKKISLKGLIDGRISSLHFKKIGIKYGKSMSLNADIDLSGLPNVYETFIYAQINELKADKADIQDFVSGLTRKPFLLPKELNQLGTVNYKGNISGFLSNLVAYGNLKTNMGSLSTDILLQLENKLKDLKYNGTLKSNNFQLGTLLSNQQLGKVSFNVNTNGSKKYASAIRGSIKARINEISFNQYDYKDIDFEGKYDGTGFDGTINLSDKNINAKFRGIIDLTRKLPIFDFELNVMNSNLYALNLIKNYPDVLLSFSGKTNMVGNSLDNINGFILFDNIKLTNKDKTLNVNEVKFVSRIENNYTNFFINSDFVNGSFSGAFRYSTVSNTINKIVKYYLPALAVRTDINEKEQNHIDIDLKISNTDAISDVLNLPYKLGETSTIKGFIDEKSNKINITAKVPSIKTAKQSIENLTFDIENQQQQLKLITRAQIPDKKESTRVYLIASASKDSIISQLGWQNSSKITNAGEVHTTTKLWTENGKMAAQMKILPTQVIISDSVWDIKASKIDLNTDSTINIHNFRFENKKQFVHINGKASKSLNDSIVVSMNNLNLEYILQLVRLNDITISGFATGRANFVSLFKHPVLLVNLGVNDLGINNKLIGNVNVNSEWDNENKKLLLEANVLDKKMNLLSNAKGSYFPKSDSIDVTFNTKGLSIEFINRYLESVVQNVKGFGYGNLRMFGPMKKIGFEGNIYVDKGQASVKMLNTTYYFNDTIRLTRKSIAMKNIKIYDEERNQGTLSGLVTHSGTFQDMKYNANISARKILGMNTHAADNEYFFGKAYATGTVSIFGNQTEANIVVNAVSQPKTKCYIQMGGASSALDNSFINYINHRSVADRDAEPRKKKANDFNVKIDMRIDVTPDAELELIVDPKAGDAITGKGNGNLRVQFDSFSDIKLFGTYAIDAGSYLFTLQTLIRKEFKIDKGSTISWTGNPFDAKVNIRALYPLNASLSDLLSDVTSTTNRGSVPVNCVLNLTDDLMKPTIKFEIDLPLSDEGVKQRVKSIINTDEMMNRQIAYLMVLGKFYTPDNTANAGLNNTISFAVSTLSSHINNWIQKSLNTNSLSLGLDWQKSELQTDEVKAQLNYQNKRIILNGEFGYRNDNINTSTNASKFIGDFDLEYLLNESGKIRAKAYSHTIDRAQLKEAKSTQGLGIIYKEDFESVGSMLNYYWNLFTGIFKKKSNE